MARVRMGAGWLLLAVVPLAARQRRRKRPGRRTAAVERPHPGRRERPGDVAWPLRLSRLRQLLRRVMLLRRRVTLQSRRTSWLPRSLRAGTGRQVRLKRHRPKALRPKALRPRLRGPAGPRLAWAGLPGSGFPSGCPPSRSGPAPALDLDLTPSPDLARSRVLGLANRLASCPVSTHRSDWRTHRRRSRCPDCRRG